ncbi:histidinol-phosphate transaminase [Clostridiaceae bacterium 35-E11]
MNFAIKPSILSLYKNSYANESALSVNSYTCIDCSSGINPFGFSEEVKKSLTNLSPELVHAYPESNEALKEAIINYWHNVIHLQYNHILLENGSIDIIYKINKLFLDYKSKVLGYSPQFTDFIDDIQSYDGIYDYQLMTMENNYKFMPKLFLEKINKQYKLIYLDNPNNPTGQIIPVSAIEEIVKKAHDLDICVIIDEAYGDFMDQSNSAMSLLNNYDNLFVLRTFSKGLGLAGIRAGYLVTSKALADYYAKISNPYSMNGIARYLATAALKDTTFLNDCRQKIRLAKKQLMHKLHKLIVLETDFDVPIMTIKHPDPQIDFEEMLKRYNILTISGKGFIGLDKSFVRLRISSSMDSLMKVFSEIESRL